MTKLKSGLGGAGANALTHAHARELATTHTRTRIPIHVRVLTIYAPEHLYTHESIYNESFYIRGLTHFVVGGAVEAAHSHELGLLAQVLASDFEHVRVHPVGRIEVPEIHLHRDHARAREGVAVYIFCVGGGGVLLCTNGCSYGNVCVCVCACVRTRVCGRRV